MSANKGFADHGECSRSIHSVQHTTAAFHHNDWVADDMTASGDDQRLPEFNYCNSDEQFHLRPLPPPPYVRLFNRRSALSSKLEYLDGGQLADQHFRMLSSEGAFCLQAELGKMKARDIMDAKALAASRSHSEAERKRRERINNHLAKLRSLLPTTTKTDKASLLAEVIQHLKELKRQTSLIEETSPIPTEKDELNVDASEDDGRFLIRASLCCEDRPDLLLELVKALKVLRLRMLKAEIITIDGRIRNVLFVTGEEDPSHSNNYARDQEQRHRYSVSSIQEALKVVIEKVGRSAGAGDDSSTGTFKRQRTNNVEKLCV